MTTYRQQVLTHPGPRPGADYRVTLFLPDCPAPRGGFPSIWYLDGNAAAADLDGQALAGIDPDRAPVLVALGQAGKDRFAGLERARDYTPEGGAPSDPRGRPAGGAPAFQTLLTDHLIPAAEACFAADPGARQLWGHSYGGLFVLRMAMQRTAPVFARFTAASPALWWDHARFLGVLQAGLRAGQGPCAPVDLHLGGAERERASRPADPSAQPLVQMRAALPPDALGGLADDLARAGNSGAFTVFPGLSHGETFTRSVREVAWRPWPVARAR
ncbi:alpha/beta hydrolase [Pseudooceanicola algae]|nr:alpha/beta hydrolase-fold protein [Pseudooceanicola algae]